MSEPTALPAALDAAADQEPLTDVIGMVDVLSETEILGWAWSPRQPGRRVVLKIVQGGKLVGTAVADRYRRDLEPNGVGDGKHAFEFIPPEGLQLQPAETAVLVEDTTIALVRNDQGAPALLVDDLMRRIIGAENAVRLLADRLVGVQRQTVTTDGNSKAVIGSLDGFIKRIDSFEAELATQREHLEQLEVFAVRFDARMAELDRQRLAAKPPPGRALFVAGCFAAAFAGTLAAHALTLLR